MLNSSTSQAPNGRPVVSVAKRGWLRRLLAFVGPAYLVSVGYMDPGNWATDIEGGARFGYSLIWVLLMSNVMAVLLQTLAARLGIVTGYDLAQACRREYPRSVTIFLWLSAELAIVATDLAEVIGTIIGLNLLFGLPLLWGCAVTALDTLLLLAMMRLGMRKMEAFIVLLIATIGACFLIEVFIAKPDWGGIATGFVPSLAPGALYVAIGIIGATVMPHNLYLHAALVQSREVANTHTGKAEACRYNLIDSTVAMNLAFFVNAAILVMAAAVFHSRGIEVTEIQQAHGLLEGLLGGTLAPLAFAVALLAAGQSSTITGTLAGQIVMEGFVDIRMRPWLRRAITRGAALIPATVVIALAGSEGTYQLLILSQVVLSLQLPFACIPLIHFTSDPLKMGAFASPLVVKVLAWVTAAIVVALNLWLVVSMAGAALPSMPVAAWVVALPFTLLVLGMLAVVTFGPMIGMRKAWESEVTAESAGIARYIAPVALRHVGIALEHTESDAEIISAALAFACDRADTRFTLIHVTESPAGMVFGTAADSLHHRADTAYLEGLAREIERDDLPVEISLRAGRPPEEIIRVVEELGIDMIVLGAHGHKGVADLVFGETVTHVRHTVAIPVFIVPLRKARAESSHTDFGTGTSPPPT